MKRKIFCTVLLIVITAVGCASAARPAGEDMAIREAAIPKAIAVSDSPLASTVPPQTPDPEPCPLTEEEYRLLAELMTCEAQVVIWDGERWGVSAYCRIAAVGWVALNRLDAGDYGDTLADVIKAPCQFAWRSGVEAPDWIKKIAEDVVRRWWAEKTGESDIGRTIPSDYLWFYGDGRENYFRNQYQGGTTWDWSLPDPYEGGPA